MSWHVRESSATLEGKRLTVTWVVDFASEFAGEAYNVYVMATDLSNISEGWKQVGAWGVGVDPSPPCARQ